MKKKAKLSLNLPIRLRLTLIFTALLMLMLITLGFGLFFIVSNSLNNRLQNDLKNSADYTLIGTAHFPDGAIILPGPLHNPDDNTILTDNSGNPQIAQFKVTARKLDSSIIIYHPDGTVLAQSDDGLQSQTSLVTAAMAAKNLTNNYGYFTQLQLPDYSNNNQVAPFLVYARPIYGLSNPTDSQSPLSLLAVYVDSRPYAETATLLSTMNNVLFIALPLALIISLAVSGFAASRALRPVKAISDTARQIGATDLSKRIGLRSSDELGQLARTFDEMIERLDLSFRRQRRFVDDASHELRTPLAVIEAEATLMLKRPRDPEDYQQALALIVEEAGRMRFLIDDMLTLARAGSGELEILPQTLNLDDLVLEAVERIARLTQQKNQNLQLETAEAVAYKGDPDLLTSLFYNLLSNAAKYTPDGGTIRVRVWQEAKQAFFEVSDNGPGIAAEHLPYLFDRFYRADRIRKRQLENSRVGSSSGLGLSIAQWIAEAHGGSIKAESIIGSGTTFRVILPLEVASKL